MLDCCCVCVFAGICMVYWARTRLLRSRIIVCLWKRFVQFRRSLFGATKMIVPYLSKFVCLLLLLLFSLQYAPTSQYIILKTPARYSRHVMVGQCRCRCRIKTSVCVQIKRSYDNSRLLRDGSRRPVHCCVAAEYPA